MPPAGPPRTRGLYLMPGEAPHRLFADDSRRRGIVIIVMRYDGHYFATDGEQNRAPGSR